MEEKPDAVEMGVLVKVIDSPGIEGAGAADDPVDFIAFFEQQIRKV
jgi:hypothetical protein